MERFLVWFRGLSMDRSMTVAARNLKVDPDSCELQPCSRRIPGPHHQVAVKIVKCMVTVSYPETRRPAGYPLECPTLRLARSSARPASRRTSRTRLRRGRDRQRLQSRAIPSSAGPAPPE